MTQSFDFIIVGSGPAGITAASALARSSKSPSVLLLEAGSHYSDQDLRVDGQRWTTFQKNPSMNWGYKTEPQELCLDRQIDYSRGRALGGSSTINFGVYTIGAKGDYDEWARVVGNDAFNWENMQRRLKALETFHDEVPKGGERYAAPSVTNHGHTGPIHVGYAPEWEKDLIPLLGVFEQAGFPLNKDHNSGNPIGMAVVINSAHVGLRNTSADAIASYPDNLTIRSDSVVQRVVIEGRKIVGVECDGKTYLASKEVVLCAGALNSPQILMHSGIGPKGQLKKYGIPVIVDSSVGQGLRDHYFTSLVHSRVDGSTDRKAFYGSQVAMDNASEKWKKDHTGDWTKFACEMAIGCFKSTEISASNEFKSLPTSEQEYLHLPTVPHYEVLSHFPVHWFIPDYPQEHLNYSCLLSFIFNSQARGEATLQSSDPGVPLKFDPKILSHPFDRRVAIESLRAILKLTEHPEYAKDTVAPIAVPKSGSDEDLLEYWKGTVNSAWHMTGTAKMGKGGDPDAVVDSQFRVLGVDNLRVADMSVLPVLPSGHTQLPAYVTGATCAEMLISEYGLQ